MRALVASLLLAFTCLLVMSTQAEGGSPEFIYAIDNITVAAGREAQVNLQLKHIFRHVWFSCLDKILQFTCVVNHLQGHKVAWLR